MSLLVVESGCHKSSVALAASVANDSSVLHTMSKIAMRFIACGVCQGQLVHRWGVRGRMLVWLALQSLGVGLSKRQHSFFHSFVLFFLFLNSLPFFCWPISNLGFPYSHPHLIIKFRALHNRGRAGAATGLKLVISGENERRGEEWRGCSLGVSSLYICKSFVQEPVFWEFDLVRSRIPSHLSAS